MFHSLELPAALSDVGVGEVGASVCDRLRAELSAHISGFIAEGTSAEAGAVDGEHPSVEWCGYRWPPVAVVPVPISARNTVTAWIIMNHQPALALPNAQAPTSCIMSPIGAAEPPACASV